MPIKKRWTIDEFIEAYPPERRAARYEQIDMARRLLNEAISASHDKPVPDPQYPAGAWLFKGYAYDITDALKNRRYTPEQIELMILEDYDKERRKFEKLMKLYKLGDENSEYKRERIPEHIRIAVWRRDEGKCARCGSREKLEYDHIVPVSKGGGSTARNIELLCESCNRKKSNNIE